MTKLTRRERDVAVLVSRGLANKQIADQLNISLGVVKIHLHNAYAKMGLLHRGSGAKRKAS